MENELANTLFFILFKLILKYRVCMTDSIKPHDTTKNLHYNYYVPEMRLKPQQKCGFSGLNQSILFLCVELGLAVVIA